VLASRSISSIRSQPEAVRLTPSGPLLAWFRKREVNDVSARRQVNAQPIAEGQRRQARAVDIEAANIIALFATTPWAGFLWSGADQLMGAQRVHGYPAATAQFDFLVGIPLVAIVTVAGTILLVNALKRFCIASNLISGTAMAALFPYVHTYGGL
jgi:hypothetical protein